jgi:ABC-type polar amino acid transport system ATPase subunit
MKETMISPLDENISTDGREVVRVRNLTKSFGDHTVLSSVDLTVHLSEVVCILGPSGSGKSTLLRCINALERPEEGTVIVCGNDLTRAKPQELPSMRHEIGMVFQSFNLFPQMSALDNVAEGPRTVLRLKKNAARERARKLLGEVGLSDKADAKPAQLSGGQQQRVAIARALAMEPKLMLFDEATSALDPELVNEVLGVMQRLANSGMTMIVVTHEINFARRAASRVCVIDDGRIIEEGPPENILVRAEHPRTRAFLQQLEH